MKHRLKNRAARLKEQRSNKQLHKNATRFEEIKFAKAEKSNGFEENADKAKLTRRGKGVGKKAGKIAKNNHKAEDVLLSHELSMPSASM